MKGTTSGPGPRLGRLVVKPELACTAACPTCSTRKALHRSMERGRFLAFADWRALFREVSGLGLSHLTISGGEPTLYNRLEEMIALGKGYGWQVELNTNGSRIDDDMAGRLVGAGLDGATVSLYAADAGLHDRMRCSPGLWRRAETALTELVRQRDDRAPGLRVRVQTILCRDNFRWFPELLEMAFRLRACSITVSYLEGDYRERKFLPDREEISEFRRDVVPRALDVIRAARADPGSKRVAMAAVGSLFAGGARKRQEYAMGIYRRPRPCAIPSFQSIVLANGDVHPCNMVEYTHRPVIGNLHERSLSGLWSSDAWRDFRRHGTDSCRFCPMASQVAIPIARPPRFARLQSALAGTPLRRLQLGIEGWALRHARIGRRLRRGAPAPAPE